MASLTPRYLPDLPLPPYGYLPGCNPHPLRDPGGHMRDAPPPVPGDADPSRWRDWPAYLRGVDLFNHGYYWEAHEAWEQAWHARGRCGVTGDLLRGLIHLAGAGFATRRGKPSGRVRHARLAGRLFDRVVERLPPDATAHLGLKLGELVMLAERIARGAALVEYLQDAPVAVVFDTSLAPG
jgi:hypothetical protein